MIPSYLLYVAVALLFVLVFGVLFSWAPRKKTKRESAGPHLVIVGSVAINVDNMAYIDGSDCQRVLISAGNELLDFTGQDAADILRYFHIPAPAAHAAHKPHKSAPVAE
jgi:hypothetical protein